MGEGVEMGRIQPISFEEIKAELPLALDGEGLLGWDPCKESLDQLEQRLKLYHTLGVKHQASGTLFLMQQTPANRNLGEFDFQLVPASKGSNVILDFMSYCQLEFGMKGLLWKETQPSPSKVQFLTVLGFSLLGKIPGALYSKGSYHPQHFLYYALGEQA
ncbi:MAG: hypothetical protein ACOVS5_10440 [Oligoflexus sp.]|jgi:hypothetical protein